MGIKKENNDSKLKVRNIVGYALGDTGGVLGFGVVGSFLQMYYTDNLHISLGKITMLMLVARIWDAFNDPLWGAFIDSRKPKKGGRFRPYILWGSFPMVIALVLMFVKIPGLSENQYLIYAYVTYIFYGMMYTCVNIPYGSLASVMTEDSDERSKLSVARSFGAGLGSFPGQILLPLVVYSTVAGTNIKYLDGNKLLVAVSIISVFILITYILSFRMTREYIELPPNQTKGNLIKSIKMLVKNKPFVALCFASMLLIGANMYIQTITNYLFKNYFGKPQLFSFVTVASYIPMLAVMPFMGKIVRKFGKKEVCAWGSLIGSLSFLVLFFIKTTNPYVYLVFMFIMGFGISFFTLEVWALVTDVIDYHELLSTRREEGTSYACFSFTRKLGQTLAGIGSTIALSIIGYSTAEGVLVQTDAVVNGMYTMATLVPFAMYMGMFLLLQFGYGLTKNKVTQLRYDLDSQRSKINI